MKTCFGFIFWGVVLIALDFRFGHFDFVPNLVGGLGFALLAIGTGGLAPMTGYFVAACTFGWLLFFAVLGRPYIPGNAQMLFGGLMMALNISMMLTTLDGVRNIALGRGRPQLVRNIAPLKQAYAAVVSMAWVLGDYMPWSTNAKLVLAVVIFAVAAVVMVMILRLLYQAWKQLSP